jgi:predicted outer membrane repeat protein
MQALGAAGSGTTLEVAQGTYKPTTSTNRLYAFGLKNNVAIYGGYSGYGTPNPDARDVIAYPTILSGDIGVVGDNSDNSYNVVYGKYLNQTAVLDGVTITGGNANHGPDNNNDAGGGLNLGSSSPTLTNVTFTGNNAIFAGGLFNASSSPTLTNCTFSGNTASVGGGGIANYNCSPVLNNCTFSGNSSVFNGGGVWNDNALPTLNSCTFNGNTAGKQGGGVYNDSSSATLTNCTFSGNTAGYGGGVYNDASPATLTNCTFNSNKVIYKGGGVYNDASSATLINCAFSANMSTQYGGALFNDASSPAVINCTFSNNPANYGGSAVANNNSFPKLTNCIVWGDTLIEFGTSNPTVTYTDIQGGFAGAGNINANPQFVRNPNAGPDGVWGTADDDFGNLRLQATSPCINVGSNLAVPAGITTDLDGNSRIMFGVVDMGCYEWQMPGDATGDGNVNILDFTALAQNFNKSPAIFSQGNFNYDATVNALDFNILATKFGTQFVAAAAPLNSAPVAVLNISPAPAASLFGDAAIATADRHIEDLLGSPSD